MRLNRGPASITRSVALSVALVLLVGCANDPTVTADAPADGHAGDLPLIGTTWIATSYQPSGADSIDVARLASNCGDEVVRHEIGIELRSDGAYGVVHGRGPAGGTFAVDGERLTTSRPWKKLSNVGMCIVEGTPQAPDAGFVAWQAAADFITDELLGDTLEFRIDGDVLMLTGDDGDRLVAVGHATDPPQTTVGPNTTGPPIGPVTVVPPSIGNHLPVPPDTSDTTTLGVPTTVTAHDDPTALQCDDDMVAAGIFDHFDMGGGAATAAGALATYVESLRGLNDPTVPDPLPQLDLAAPQPDGFFLAPPTEPSPTGRTTLHAVHRRTGRTVATFTIDRMSDGTWALGGQSNCSDWLES